MGKPRKRIKQVYKITVPTTVKAHPRKRPIAYVYGVGYIY